MLACATASRLRIIGSPPLTGDSDSEYSFSVSGVGGSRPYSYELTGVWPDGISVDATGFVSGIPAAGLFTDLSIRVTDGRGITADLAAFPLIVAVNAVGTASGVATVSGVGASTVATTGSSSGIATVTGVGYFDPTLISGLEMWLDFTDGGNVTLVSGNISQVTDKSGNSRHATQSNAGNRPGYSALCPNGDNAGSFNGSSTYLQTPSFSLAQPFSIICVGKNSSDHGYFHDSPSGTRIAQLWAGNTALGASGPYLFGWAGSGNGNGDTVTNDENRDIVSCFIADGASSKMFINDVQRGTTGQGSGTGGIASGLLIGINQGLGFLLNGYIAHILIYNSALGTSDRQNLQNWVKSVTGITF